MRWSPSFFGRKLSIGMTLQALWKTGPNSTLISDCLPVLRGWSSRASRRH